jgi:isochorismate pyruvate lyase
MKRGGSTSSAGASARIRTEGVPVLPIRHFTGSTWEPKVGYCRALRQGPFVWVSGTAPSAPGGGLVAPGEPYPQAVRCLEIVRDALAALGAGMEHVVRTRMFVSDGSRWEEYGKAHAEFFGKHPPATTMVEVAGFVDPGMTIEIEADAYVPGAPARARSKPHRRPSRTGSR